MCRPMSAMCEEQTLVKRNVFITGEQVTPLKAG